MLDEIYNPSTAAEEEFICRQYNLKQSVDEHILQPLQVVKMKRFTNNK